ncbi:GlsB/YeaQ/YmgE family stress response membrane protein [Tautonia marina]|uniref:GlsB/YeaQ/YmgE family stress response membrane protein n=1 Tax=Tautonia marina TaxID=2653855 RepID=UPI001F189ACA|nr:GlsB/YeaQ/YmgE family stress response membrane protein [Tautonia marina]
MGTIGAVLGWILFGLVVGFLARLLHPGKDEMGLPATVLLGVAGSLLGGGFWYLLRGGGEAFSPGGFFSALIFAIVLLAVGVFANDSRSRNVRG